MIAQRNAAAPTNSDLASGAIGAATVVAHCQPSDAPAAETIGIPLALAIQQHRAALAAQDDAGRIHDERAEEKRARPGDVAAAAAFEEAETAFYATCDLEQEAHYALLAVPVRSFADMRAKASYLASVSAHMVHDQGTMATLLASMADFDGRA